MSDSSLGLEERPRNPDHRRSIQAGIPAELLDQEAVSRLWQRVDKNGPVPEHVPHLGRCWIWTGAQAAGYGVISIRGKRALVHRIVHALLIGPVEGWDVLHHCDNPPCCNPEHLWHGTNCDNVQDMCKKGRHATGVVVTVVGEQNGRSKLTDADVIDIRKLASDGVPTTEISERYNMSYVQIYNIVNGTYWNHLPVLGWPTGHPIGNPGKLTIGDRTLSIRKWAKISGVNFSSIAKRIERGWGTEEAVFTPVSQRRRPTYEELRLLMSNYDWQKTDD